MVNRRRDCDALVNADEEIIVKRGRRGSICGSSDSLKTTSSSSSLSSLSSSTSSSNLSEATFAGGDEDKDGEDNSKTVTPIINKRRSSLLNRSSLFINKGSVSAKAATKVVFKATYISHSCKVFKAKSSFTSSCSSSSSSSSCSASRKKAKLNVSAASLLNARRRLCF